MKRRKRCPSSTQKAFLLHVRNNCRCYFWCWVSRRHALQTLRPCTKLLTCAGGSKSCASTSTYMPESTIDSSEPVSTSTSGEENVSECRRGIQITESSMLSYGSEYKKPVTLGHWASILDFMGFSRMDHTCRHTHTQTSVYIYIYIYEYK